MEEAIKADGTVRIFERTPEADSRAPLLSADPGKMEAIIALNFTALMGLTYAAALESLA